MDLAKAMHTFLPWQQRQWILLADACKAHRLGHALLLHGSEGTGVPQFAGRFATALVCQKATSSRWPCGVCQACHLSHAGSHPDLMLVEPDDGKTTIGIAQIRRLIEALGLAPKLAGSQIAIVSPAESLTREAANSLLKTLEEPPGQVVFLLVAHSLTRLPATVRSRCQLIEFPIPSRNQASQWLAEETGQPADVELALDIAGGAPFRALDMIRTERLPLRSKVFESLIGVIDGQADPFEVAQLWRTSGTREVLRWLASFSADCIRLSYTQMPRWAVNRDSLAALVRLAQCIEPHRFYELWDRCIQASKEYDASSTVNDQLLLEDVAMVCAALAPPRITSSPNKAP